MEGTRFLVDKGAVKVLKPSEMIEDKSVTNILQEKRPNSAPLYHGTFNLNETPPIEKLSVIRGIVERQSRKLVDSSGPVTPLLELILKT